MSSIPTGAAGFMSSGFGIVFWIFWELQPAFLLSVASHSVKRSGGFFRKFGSAAQTAHAWLGVANLATASAIHIVVPTTRESSGWNTLNSANVNAEHSKFSIRKRMRQIQKRASAVRGWFSLIWRNSPKTAKAVSKSFFSLYGPEQNYSALLFWILAGHLSGIEGGYYCPKLFLKVDRHKSPGDEQFFHLCSWKDSFWRRLNP